MRMERLAAVGWFELTPAELEVAGAEGFGLPVQAAPFAVQLLVRELAAGLEWLDAAELAFVLRQVVG